MEHYLPEKLYLQSSTPPKTTDDLRRAMHTGEIVAGIALRCDEAHNLHVQFGSAAGVIARADAALGIAEGRVRDIAILSRVGKPVCCKVLDILPDGTAQLSRTAAQREAADDLIASRRPGDVIPAVVTSLAPFGAFCDIGCGVTALLGLENISVARISHSHDRFSVGQQIFAAILRTEPDDGRITLTHRELLGTWEENAAQFHAGETVTGVVRSVHAYGVFIELTPNLSGLAEPDDDLKPGDAVSVYIKSILPNKLKIKLAVMGKLEAGSLPPLPIRYQITGGHLDYWQYSPLAPRFYTVFST